MSGMDPHSYCDASQGKIQHLEFDIEIDFKAKTLSVKTQYQLEQPVSGTLSLDTRDLDLLVVTSKGHELDFTLGEPDVILGQRLELTGLDQVQTFTIESRTSPSAEALQWLLPEQTSGGEHPFLYSQCQAIAARSVFPCQDSPAIRLTYTASVKVLQPFRVVMAAESLGATDEGAFTTYRFRMPQPIPAYLFALAAGNLAFGEIGPRTGIYAEPEILEAAVYEFAENEEKMALAEKLFGPYKWDRYDMLVLPPAFPYGGMENPRLTFLTSMEIQGDRRHTDIVSHELAHAWTGNLVTNASWEHFWLNEGWTTYAEMRISEAVYGKDHVEIMHHARRETMFEAMDRLGRDSDHTRLRQELAGKALITTTIPYIKGYNFFLLAEGVVGRARFDAFILKYIETFAFQSLTTEAFLAFLRQELPEVVEQVDVDTWIYGTGFPDSAPAIHSKLLDEVTAAVDRYTRSEQLSRAEVAPWGFLQRITFLRSIPESVPVEDTRALEILFGIDEDTYPLVLGEFYRLCIRSGRKDILPQVETLLANVGRVLVILPLFKELIEAEWSRDRARPLFEKVRSRYHAHTIRAIERIFEAFGM